MVAVSKEIFLSRPNLFPLYAETPTVSRSAPEKVFDGLVECVWSFQVGNVSNVRQFNEARARDRLCSLFGKLRNIPKISSQIDRGTIFTQGGMIFLSDNEKRRNFDFGELVANGLLIDHESR